MNKQIERDLRRRKAKKERELFYWSEERGEKFLSKYWMRAAYWDEDEKLYSLNINAYHLYNWTTVTKNPILRKWARKNKLQINKLFLNNWTPSGFERRDISGREWYTIEFEPIQKDKIKEEKKMKKIQNPAALIAIIVACIAIPVIYSVVIGTSGLPDWVKFLLLSK